MRPAKSLLAHFFYIRERGARDLARDRERERGGTDRKRKV